MSDHNTAAFIFDLFLSLGIVLAVYKLIANSLKGLLDGVIRMPEGTTFYMRALLLVLLCAALSKTIAGIHEKPEAHAIEYVWAVAGHLSDVLESICLTVLAYVAFLTVLVAVLKRQNEQ